MEYNPYELDLLDFHGDPLELDLESEGQNTSWLLDSDEDDDFPFKIDDDAPFRASLTAQMSDTTVHIDGHVSAQLYYRCGRCLEWRPFDLDEEVQFVLMSRPSWDEAYGGEDEIALNEADLDVSYYEDEIIDLRPLLREAVLLTLPDFPQCTPDLSDACDEAYERVVGEETLEQNEDASIDLRWSKLKDIDLDDDAS